MFDDSYKEFYIFSIRLNSFLCSKPSKELGKTLNCEQLDTFLQFRGTYYTINTFLSKFCGLYESRSLSVALIRDLKQYNNVHNNTITSNQLLRVK